MPGPYDSYQTDSKAQTDGVWATFDGGFEILLARMSTNNPKYAGVLNRRMQTIGATGDDISGMTEKGLRVLNESMAEAVILDWRVKGEDGEYESSVSGPNGTSMTATFDNKVKLLNDLPDLRDEIAAYAAKRQNFLRSKLDATAGKSTPSSESITTA